MTSQELKGLVKQLQQGDMSVFDNIYYETKDIIYYTIFSILKDHSSAEDFMQETFLQALEKIHTYKPRSSFKSWIITIARNLSLNEYNKRKRELKIDPQTDEYIFGSVEPNSEQEAIIKELLTTLEDTEKEIVLLHVVGDLKHREISKILGIPLGTVTWKYNEAIKKLRNTYESR